MKLVVLVGPPGSGKSTLAKEYEARGYLRVSQDVSGKDHLRIFSLAVASNQDIVLDRMNFTVSQRARYLDEARAHGYETEIIVLHQPAKVCLERIRARVGHETIKDEKACRGALRTFFTKYERVQDGEANKVTRVWPEGEKYRAIWVDMDNTLSDATHREYFGQFARLNEDLT